MFRSLFASAKSSSHEIEASAQRRHEAEVRGQIDAINRVQAVIRFAMDGTILDANENFLNAMGYTLEEIKGRHHSMFLDPGYARTPEYAEFWRKLNRGEFQSATYKRIAKSGKEVWLQASYNPVFDANGDLFQVVKFATDITAEKLKNIENQGQIEAIHRVQGVIEFDLEGKILTANRNFLDLMGYTLAEVQGRHHSLFVEPGEEKTAAYQDFWRNLRAGHPDSRVYKRFGKYGKQVWIQASYNPILDLEGHPIKVVKFASDLTGIISQTEVTQTTAQSVATATEELSSSIGEISHNMALSKEATDKITATSTASGTEASHLVNSMKAMQQIVKLIHEIAGRVKLLALNATIEAARAGDAGRGFAVVANEVRSLSDQTEKATNEINQEISSVQAISSRVADSIHQTVVGVTLVNQYVSSVAVAMEEQTAVTREISQHATGMVTAVEQILDRTRNGARDTGAMYLAAA